MTAIPSTDDQVDTAEARYSQKPGEIGKRLPNAQDFLEEGEHIVWQCKPSITPVGNWRRVALLPVMVFIGPIVFFAIFSTILTGISGNGFQFGKLGIVLVYGVVFLCAALVLAEYLRQMQWLFRRRISYVVTNKRYIRLASGKITDQIGLSSIHRPHLSGMPETAPRFYRAINSFLKPPPYIVIVPKERSDWNTFNGKDTLAITGCKNPKKALKSLQTALDAAQ